MIRLIIFSDLHIDLKAIYSKPTADGLSDYLSVLKKSMGWLCGLLRGIDLDKGCRNVVCFLGDLFESCGHIDTTCLAVASELFEDLADACTPTWGDFPIVAVTGNHDFYAPNIHNLEFLKLIRRRNVPRIFVAERPGFVSSRFLFCSEEYLYCLPYTDNIKSVSIPSTAKVVLSHNNIIGGVLSKSSQVRVSETGIDPALFGKPVVFNGHYHHPGTVATVHNVGALCSRTLKDVNSDPRGIIIAEVDETTWEVSVERYTNFHDIPIVDVLVDSEEKACQLLESNELAGKYARLSYTPELSDIAEAVGATAVGSTYCSIKQEKQHLTREVLSEKFLPEENLKLWAYTEVTDSSIVEKVIKAGIGYLDVAYKIAGEKHTSGALPLEFVKLTVKDFMALGEVELTFKDGLTYIDGVNASRNDSNGSAKTTLLAASFWCLTGSTFGAYVGDDVIRWLEDSEGVVVGSVGSCSVELELFVGTKYYRVGRYRNHREYGSRSKLWELVGETYEDISPRLGKETDKKIIDLIGRSETLLKQIIFLSCLKDRFSYLSHSAKVKLIESITDSGVYSVVHQLVKEDSSLASMSLLGLEAKNKDLSTKLKLCKERYDGLGQQLEKLTVVSEGEDASVLQSTLDDLRAKLGVCERKYDAHLDQSVVLEKEIIEFTKKIDGARGVYSEESSKNVKLETTIGILKRQIKAHKELLVAGQCPTCGSVVGKESKVSTELVGLCEQLRSVTQQLETSDLVKKYSILRELDQSREKVNEEFIILHDECAKLKSVISRLKDKIHQVESDLVKKQNEEKEKESSTIEICTRMDEVSRQVANLESELASVLLRLSDVKLGSEVLSYLEVAFGVTGIRSRMLGAVTLPFLNSRLEVYSSMCLPVQLVSEVENKSGDTDFKIDVQLLHGRSFVGASSGERQAVDLAVQLALNDLAVATGDGYVNVLLCDEVLDHLDRTAQSALLDILKTKAKNQAVLLTAHVPYLDTVADYKLTMYKEGGVSSLIESQPASS